jgi:hypothetical protein
VTHRIDVLTQDLTVTLEFQGQLDAPALADLEAALAFARREGVAVRILLRAGTQAERDCLAALRSLDAELVAEAPYLASWLAL